MSRKRTREEVNQNNINPEMIGEIIKEIDGDILMHMINNPYDIVDENEVIKKILQKKNIEITEENINLFKKQNLKTPTETVVDWLTQEYYVYNFVPKINDITILVSRKISKKKDPTQEKEIEYFKFSLLNTVKNFFEKQGYKLPEYNKLQPFINICVDLYTIFRKRMGTQAGVAFEVHNLFKKIYSKKKEYMEIIEPFIDKSSEYNIRTEELYNYIDTVFKEQIFKLFKDIDNKIDLFQKLLQRASPILIFVPSRHHRLLLEGLEPATPQEKKLIGDSVNFVSKQSDDFKRQYILSFIDESCSSQTTTGSTPAMSCARGIAERFVTAIGSTVKILCIEENEDCNDVYKKLDKLMNPKFDIAKETAEWFNEIDSNKDYKDSLPKDAVGRIQVYMDYLKKKSLKLDGRKLEDTYIKNYIENQNFMYTFEDEDLRLGGKKINYKKSKKNTRKKRVKNTRKKRVKNTRKKMAKK